MSVLGSRDIGISELRALELRIRDLMESQLHKNYTPKPENATHQLRGVILHHFRDTKYGLSRCFFSINSAHSEPPWGGGKASQLNGESTIWTSRRAIGALRADSPRGDQKSFPKPQSPLPTQCGSPPPIRKKASRPDKESSVEGFLESFLEGVLPARVF